ncbi:rho GTPase-activating protein 22 isoform X2 [Thunnus albacares]|nr:rho GTPase-activating protein 22 isoform X1 [Thunnus maccoyii]XP_042252754.1 rho GTPase-activating protein 22 isoform X1 [Thunnus maccoyii]XP_044194318.1 rho GTPase-activating protein 22 isoform X2 [Thunnus albacares]XP_044194319.1 rho GTPase-activating protein 22 isoform X2 [Thunnus albacares]
MTTMLSPKIRQTRRARSKSMVMGEVSRGPCRPASPSLQEGALKAGWLKKQRSIMKNWQLRWFVLRSDQLFFYKDEEETKPQGCITLQGCQVNELTANPDEPGRHLFEIVPGGTGDKDRAPISHESFLLMANSQTDMDDWVKAIRRVIWAPFGGGIFGQRLEDTVQYEKKFGPRLAPLLVEQCVDFIRERGLDEEGLFRMPGQANLVKELQEAFDCGDKPLFDSNTEVHTVASLLKLYLRELPEPVIPFSKYEDFLTCAQLLVKDEEEGVQELGKQVSTLPLPNYNLLKYICKFLDEVQSHCYENKMSVQNLATVFGPNILRPKMEDPVTIMEGTSLVQHLMTILIREHNRLYSGRDQEGSTVPQTELPVQGHQLQHRSLGAWISEEDLHSCPVSNPDQELHSSASSLDAKLCAAITPTQTPNPNPGPKLGSPSGKGDTVVSPSKQAKTMPSWKYSFKSSSAPRSQPQAKQSSGGSVADTTSVSSGGGGGGGGGNWLMNGLSSLRGHRRTSSGERSARDRDSTGSSQRLSTYDNVTSSSSMGSVPSVASTPWSTSSCEISVPESGSSEPSANQICGAGGESGEKGEWMESQREIDRGRDGGMTTDPSSEQDSCEAMELCSSSAACSENGHMAMAAGVPSIIMSEDGDGTNITLSNLVEGLKDELRKQKTVYEARIQKLEDSSAALCAQMERLEQEMEQERKKQRMLEIKLRNSERAREDAENRNRLLEKEMEDFFSTLGDLALGARTSDI